MSADSPVGPARSPAEARAATRALVARIPPLDDRERHTIAWVLQWIDAGFDLWRTQRPATPPVHLAVYGVLTNGSRILLGAHRKSGLWLPAGGHVDPGELPHEAAARELHEELGCTVPITDEPPLFVSRHVVDASSQHTDVSLWYRYPAPDQTLRADDQELAEIRWFETDALPEQTVPALPRFVQKL